MSHFELLLGNLKQVEQVLGSNQSGKNRQQPYFMILFQTTITAFYTTPIHIGLLTTIGYGILDPVWDIGSGIGYRIRYPITSRSTNEAVKDADSGVAV